MALFLYTILLVLCVEVLLVSSFTKTRSTVRNLSSNLNKNLPRSYELASSGSDNNLGEYTQKQLLKEETEAPFRKVRIFGYASLLAAAGIGSLISITKVVAVSVGARTEDMTEVYSNLAINLLGLPAMTYLWRRELTSQKSLLERIQKGGSLAGLKVKMDAFDGPNVVKLADLRRDRGIDKRVVIVVAGADALRSSIKSSMSLGASLEQNDLVIVPVLIDNIQKGENQLSYSLSAPSMQSLLELGSDDSIPVAMHVAQPVGLSAWNEVMKKEVGVALKQQPDALDKGNRYLRARRHHLIINRFWILGVTIIIKKNGKVGTRRFGVPIWESLVEDVALRKELGLDVRNI